MFIVVELQTNNEGSTAHIVTAHATRDEAESKFHFVLAAAAVSELALHAAVILDAKGQVLGNGFYRHGEENED